MRGASRAKTRRTAEAGARTTKQLTDILGALDNPLTAHEIADVEAIVPPGAIEGPRYQTAQMIISTASSDRRESRDRADAERAPTLTATKPPGEAARGFKHERPGSFRAEASEGLAEARSETT